MEPYRITPKLHLREQRKKRNQLVKYILVIIKEIALFILLLVYSQPANTGTGQHAMSQLYTVIQFLKVVITSI